MHPWRAAIFDMDGLLIDSEPVWLACEAEVLAELYGIEVQRMQLLAWQGRSSREFCIGMAQAYAAQGVDADALLQALLERMGQRIITAPLMPGAKALLDWLAGQQIPLAIASSSPLPFIEAVVATHRLPVQVFASGAEVPRSKPHPAVFELAATRLESVPEQCWVWEDSINGVIAARAAGMSVTAIPEASQRQSAAFSLAHQMYESLHESLSALRHSQAR